ncbi:hypothetical protein ACFQ3P_25700 [Paraburkholderia sabiae]|uniref:Uncharacterized protein n=1 Tax=Paraburkholderia sabiae TaxID=273251 RepID=A0ABU9QLT5_9BURK|nr:hypothetical protein [Paraburkholderia sabiae]WJZ77308.1 hypothetical protein QEN71_35135 [Paraburkholderia sabiae]CAD6547980.1 hypothetical protein LMG24235_04512 [Paraburkholderia sabiae]
MSAYFNLYRPSPEDQPTRGVLLKPRNPGDPPWIFWVASLVTSTALKSAASHITDEQKRASFIKGLDAQIAADVDELCPRPPRPPFPPGPNSFAFEVASELSLAAASLTEGQIRSELQSIAGLIVERSLA